MPQTPLREWKPRLSVEISQTQEQALRELVPHNMKSPMVRAMVNMLIHLLRENPNARLSIISLIIAEEFDLARATFQAAEQRSELRSATR